MKIIVTSLGEDKDSPVDPRFGRAAKFIVFDTATGNYQALDNSQNLNATHGAGIQTAMNVSRLGVNCLITGNCGPKAFRALQAAGIRVVLGAEGTVAEAVDKLMKGELSASDKPNVEGHWVI